MDLIVEMRFGARLYGTETPQSDEDFKGVYLPEAKDILLQRVAGSVMAARAKAPGEKTAAGEAEGETYSLQQYLRLLAEGQTVALDMFFAPEPAMLRPPAPLWRDIQANASRLLSRQGSAFLRYCRQQANKYGSKSTRLANARAVLHLLSEAEARLGTAAKLWRVEDEMTALTTLDHVGLVDIELPNGRSLRHLDVCGKRISFTVSLKTVREIVERLVSDYGERAVQAERNEGIDWKALSHAVRIGRKAIELFDTGHITLPLPYADHIRRIKCGEIAYAAVAEEIETLLGAVETAAAASSLPEAPDHAFIEDLILRAHRDKVLGRKILAD